MSNASLPASDAALSINAEQPWLGLASFSEETREYFHGRDEEIGELCRRVQRKTLTTLFGQSGLGKTSILRAGVVPRLRAEGYCAAYVRVDYSAEAPPPAEQLKQAIFRATADIGIWTKTGAAVPGESLWEFLHHRDDVLRDASGRTLMPLLIFDQFEEIFTLAQTDDAGRRRAAEFIEQLADLVENRPPKDLEARIEQDDSVAVEFDFNRTDYRVLIALREDYLAHLESLRTSMPSITQNRMRLARMTGEQALAAVLRPGGRLVSQEVAEAIVRFVAGGAELRNAEVEPSLLSLICRELNNARIAQGRKEISADLLAGSHDAILGDFYERALADQPLTVRNAIEDNLLTDSGYRENLAEERVLKILTDANAQPDAAGTLATLVNRRLLRVEDRLDLRRVELTHDVLCGVVAQSRRSRREREAKELAERQLAEQEAQAAATRAALVRARRIAAGCALLALVAVGSAAFGIFSARRASLAEAEALKVRGISEASRAEAERLVVFLLEDFYDEVQPIGRIDAVATLARRTVSYYTQLPPEARTPISQRNAALAQARLASVLSALGRDGDALKVIADAEKSIAILKSIGDKSDDTLIAIARLGLTRSAIENSRGDFVRAQEAGLSALGSIKPLLDRPTPPTTAVVTATRLYRSVGFSLARNGDGVNAIQNFSKGYRLLLDLGAKDPANAADAAEFVRIGWLYGETLINAGRPADALTVLQESIEVADGILASNPAHRPALRAKATAVSQLASVQSGRLQFAKALEFSRTAAGIGQSLAELEPKESRNNLRVHRFDEYQALFQLGRIADSNRILAIVSRPDPNEALGGFALYNLVRWQAFSASAVAAEGRMNEAKAFLDLAVASAALHAKFNPNRVDNDLLQAAIALHRGKIDFLQGKLSGIEAMMSQPLAAAAAWRATVGTIDYFGFGMVIEAHAIAGEAAALSGNHALAERHARAELQESLRQTRPSLADQARSHLARIRLALALARQGEVVEAKTTLQPALDYLALPAVRASDSVLLNGMHARALLASALVTAEKRSELLTAALQRFDRMPAPVRRLRDQAMIREDIEREIRRGARPAGA